MTSCRRNRHSPFLIRNSQLFYGGGIVGAGSVGAGGVAVGRDVAVGRGGIAGGIVAGRDGADVAVACECAGTGVVAASGEPAADSPVATGAPPTPPMIVAYRASTHGVPLPASRT